MLLHGRLDDLRQQAAEEGRHETLEELFLRLTEEPETPAEPATAGEA